MLSLLVLKFVQFFAYSLFYVWTIPFWAENMTLCSVFGFWRHLIDLLNNPDTFSQLLSILIIDHDHILDNVQNYFLNLWQNTVFCHMKNFLGTLMHMPKVALKTDMCFFIWGVGTPVPTSGYAHDICLNRVAFIWYSCNKSVILTLIRKLPYKSTSNVGLSLHLLLLFMYASIDCSNPHVCLNLCDKCGATITWCLHIWPRIVNHRSLEPKYRVPSLKDKSVWYHFGWN